MKVHIDILRLFYLSKTPSADLLYLSISCLLDIWIPSPNLLSYTKKNKKKNKWLNHAIVHWLIIAYQYPFSAYSITPNHPKPSKEKSPSASFALFFPLFSFPSSRPSPGELCRPLKLTE